MLCNNYCYTAVTIETKQPLPRDTGVTCVLQNLSIGTEAETKGNNLIAEHDMSNARETQTMAVKLVDPKRIDIKQDGKARRLIRC